MKPGAADMLNHRLALLAAGLQEKRVADAKFAKLVQSTWPAGTPIRWRASQGQTCKGEVIGFEPADGHLHVRHSRSGKMHRLHPDRLLKDNQYG